MIHYDKLYLQTKSEIVVYIQLCLSELFLGQLLGQPTRWHVTPVCFSHEIKDVAAASKKQLAKAQLDIILLTVVK